jgi:hypothetical protein
MKAWSKEVIRYGPEDVVSFSKLYFAAASKGGSELQEFLNKCDYRISRCCSLLLLSPLTVYLCLLCVLLT